MEARHRGPRRQHGIELAAFCAWARDPVQRGGRLEIPIPRSGARSHFIALHEIGHLVGKGRSAPRLESEANAWLFALEHTVVEPIRPRCTRSEAHGYGVVATASTAGSCLGSCLGNASSGGCSCWRRPGPGPTMLSVVELKQVAGRT